MKYEDIKKILFSNEIWKELDCTFVVGMTGEEERMAYRRGWYDAVSRLREKVTRAEMKERGEAMLFEPGVKYSECFFRHGENGGEFVKKEDLTAEEAAAVEAHRKKTERKKE